MKQFLLLITSCLLLSLQGRAQGQVDRQHLIDKRLVNIDRYHAGAGLTTEFNQNVYLGPQVFLGWGSSRHLFCADVGAKYLFGNSFSKRHENRISLQQFAVFATADVNAVRWSSGCAYLGGGVDWRLATGSKYVEDATSLSFSDSHITQSHTSLHARIGVRWGERWKTELSYTYDLAPAFDQKYVFESSQFDFASLRDCLYERTRLGITLSYLFPF